MYRGRGFTDTYGEVTKTWPTVSKWTKSSSSYGDYHRMHARLHSIWAQNKRYKLCICKINYSWMFFRKQVPIGAWCHLKKIIRIHWIKLWHCRDQALLVCHWDDFGPQGWTKHRNVLQTKLQREFHVALKPLKGVRYRMWSGRLGGPVVVSKICQKYFN